MEDFSVSKYFRDQLLEQDDQLQPEDEVDSAFTKQPDPEPEKDTDDFDHEKIAQALPEFEELMAKAIGDAFDDKDAINHVDAGAYLDTLKKLLADKEEVNSVLDVMEPKEAVNNLITSAGFLYFTKLVDERNIDNYLTISKPNFELALLFDPFIYNFGKIQNIVKNKIKNKSK